MRALVSRHRIPPGEGDLLVSSGELWCLVTSGPETPEGSRRIPVMIASRLMRRDGTVWHSPDTAAAGHRALAERTSEWLSGLASAATVGHRYAPESTALSSKPRNGLIEAQAARKRGNRRP